MVFAASTALLVLAAGCSSGDTATVAASRDTLANGVVRVRYASLPGPLDPPLEADLRIGAMDGDDHYVFGDVRSVEAGPDGTIYVLDYQASEIRAFDGEGRFLRVVARKGEGPGEISEANGMILADDGTLWVQDHSQWMMIGLDTAGGEVGRVPMHVRSYGYIWSGTLDHRGRFWKATSHSDVPRSYPPPEGLLESSGRSYLKWYDPATERTDSLYLGEFTGRSFVSRNSMGGYSYAGIPHTPRPLTLVDRGGGFWRATSDEYRIARLDERGDTVLLVEAGVEPLPVTAADRTEYVEQVAERDPGRRRAAEQIAELMPETKPVIASLVMDDGGRLWVERVTREDEAPVYDVFTRDGDYRGSARLAFRPASYFVPRIRRGSLYTLVRDSLDVPYVVRAELPRELVR